MLPEFRLTLEQEKARYLQHENNLSGSADKTDSGYVNFLTDFLKCVLPRLPKGAAGLDFGSGPSPALVQLFAEKGIPVQAYDPFFNVDSKLLQVTYDFITVCEVAEHFWSPATEFTRLHEMLNPGGLLALNTLLYDSAVLKSNEDFDRWHYRRDATHVSFYSEKTVQWLVRNFNFSNIEIVNSRVILLTR